MNPKSLFILLSICGINLRAIAQTCRHLNLSKAYDYMIVSERYPLSDSVFYGANMSLQIFRKNKPHVWQSIRYKASVLYEDAFKNCNATRSYITGYRKNAEVPDYDFGDLVIADLNFDKLEDIAIKYDSGGSSGPLYYFYFQDKSGHFYLSKYLTDHVGSFPAYINLKEKTIATQIHANVRYESKKTFRYNSKTKRWKLIRWQMVN
ncbi:hypothetical protein SNE26_27740 [Mucilaginibacter sp. cycad4]|uniref:XAC2610-related protein n=1 Tax=Mucilaginibacter sp. cycad4 TaxID=3342096 RepID=UPI002AAB214F|nr:hypothetical protein [Mucilaginibacter gossypii]WPU99808.1 hypothetical protein SNE26_27740 [Mucilaginibacter gossypii]